MKWHELVFSQESSKRLLRHFVFWMAWLLYFSYCDYLYQRPVGTLRPMYVVVGSHILVKTFLLISIYAVACYTFIYLLLPLGMKARWWKAGTSSLLLCAFLFYAAYFLFWSVFPYVDLLYGTGKPTTYPTKFWPAVYLGLINPTKVAVFAGSIKYVKYWWQKQRETEKLQTEKLNKELQLLKAQVHPSFLFSTLNKIYDQSLQASPGTSGMLLRLSDILSYMLYECDNDLVPLSKDLSMMKDYIELEKTREGESLEMEISIRGETGNKQIAPFLLLPFIENSFRHCAKMTEQSWINMDINVEEDMLSMKLANGIAKDVDHDRRQAQANGLANVQKRLTLMYPGRHELKMTVEQEMFIVFLKIRLDDAYHDQFETVTNSPILTRNANDVAITSKHDLTFE